MSLSYFKAHATGTKKLMSLLLSVGCISLAACAGNLPLNSNGIPATSVKLSQQKGASITIKINRGLNFSAKATANGTPAKTYFDIKSYAIYLITSTTAVFPLDGDPLLPANIVYTTKVNASENSTDLVTFNDVLDSAGKFYHVAVRAYDGPLVTGEPSGTELIKVNNGSATAWTGTTAATPINGKVAVSAGEGIEVDTSVTSTGTATLEVTPKLLDMVGATIDFNIDVDGGSKNNVTYYKINFCSDRTKPITTKLLATPVRINVGYAEYTPALIHRLVLKNVIPRQYYSTSGPYFATIQAFDASDTNVTAANNSGTTYASPDNGQKVGVTTTSVTVSEDFVLTFSPAAPASFDLALHTN
jgi:hypothetical protein